MTDVFDAKTRSAVMRAVAGRGTAPEIAVRRLIWSLGGRYRLNRADLPGKPDIVLAGRRLAIFVHGCFWHGHDCPLFRLPATRPEFWRAKIDANRARDERVVNELRRSGWRVLIVWECALRGPGRRSLEDVTVMSRAFLDGGDVELQIPGVGRSLGIVTQGGPCPDRDR